MFVEGSFAFVEGSSMFVEGSSAFMEVPNNGYECCDDAIGIQHYVTPHDHGLNINNKKGQLFRLSFFIILYKNRLIASCNNDTGL